MTEDEAIALVMKFLRATEDRDLQVSEAMMAPGSKITFPGNVVFASQTEMVKASISRYHWVKKTYELAESFIKGEDFLVYVMGTLYGENRHGVSFSDIRYIDRFVIRDSLIAQQDVWNDLSASGVLDRTSD